MEITELNFDIVRGFRYNENDKDHDQVYYQDKPVYRTLVIDGKLRASGPLTNVHLPFYYQDDTIKFFAAPSSLSSETVHNEIKNILRK